MATGLVRKLEPCSLGEIGFEVGRDLGWGSVPTAVPGMLFPSGQHLLRNPGL